METELGGGLKFVSDLKKKNKNKQKNKQIPVVSEETGALMEMLNTLWLE